MTIHLFCVESQYLFQYFFNFPSELIFLIEWSFLSKNETKTFSENIIKNLKWIASVIRFTTYCLILLFFLDLQHQQIYNSCFEVEPNYEAIVVFNKDIKIFLSQSNQSTLAFPVLLFDWLLFLIHNSSNSIFKYAFESFLSYSTAF